MPYMDMVRLDTVLEDGTGITASSRKLANIIPKARRDFAFRDVAVVAKFLSQA